MSRLFFILLLTWLIIGAIINIVTIEIAHSNENLGKCVLAFRDKVYEGTLEIVDNGTPYPIVRCTTQGSHNSGR